MANETALPLNGENRASNDQEEPMTEFAVDPRAASYYPAALNFAIQVAKERVEEWDYESDKHGYCHERPEWIALIQAAERWLEVGAP